MHMVWHDLLFMHWPVPVETLRPLIPERLAIDTFEGNAWIGVVPFRMTGVTPHRFPSLPWFSAFPELNVRTYVRDQSGGGGSGGDGDDKRVGAGAGAGAGVWFFSLDAANPVAVAVARRFFHLPYFRARMSILERGGVLFYQSVRHHGGAPPAKFKARYRPVGNVFTSAPGSLEFWLTERYCLFAGDRQKRLWRTEVHHERWPLQRAEAGIETNVMTEGLGFTLPETRPVLHFSRALRVIAAKPRLLPGATGEAAPR